MTFLVTAVDRLGRESPPGEATGRRRRFHVSEMTQANAALAFHGSCTPNFSEQPRSDNAPAAPVSFREERTWVSSDWRVVCEGLHSNVKTVTVNLDYAYGVGNGYYDTIGTTATRSFSIHHKTFVPQYQQNDFVVCRGERWPEMLEDLEVSTPTRTLELLRARRRVPVSIDLAGRETWR